MCKYPTSYTVFSHGPSNTPALHHKDIICQEPGIQNCIYLWKCFLQPCTSQKTPSIIIMPASPDFRLPLTNFDRTFQVFRPFVKPGGIAHPRPAAGRCGKAKGFKWDMGSNPFYIFKQIYIYIYIWVFLFMGDARNNLWRDFINYFRASPILRNTQICVSSVLGVLQCGFQSLGLLEQHWVPHTWAAQSMGLDLFTHMAIDDKTVRGSSLVR